MAWEIKTTDIEWRKVPEPQPIGQMKIKTTAKCKTIDNKPVTEGKTYEVDSNTARNLIKKGMATAADDEAKDLDLEIPSRLTEEQAIERSEALDTKRAEQKAKDDKAASERKSKKRR